MGAAKEQARLQAMPEGTPTVDDMEGDASNQSLYFQDMPKVGETFYDTEADNENDEFDLELSKQQSERNDHQLSRTKEGIEDPPEDENQSKRVRKDVNPSSTNE